MILENKHVFVVEDNAQNLAIVSAVLRRNGATVSFDRWGIETAERMARLNKIDIILLDLMFPRGVTGYDVFDKIKSYPELADIPIVAVTASDPSVEMNKVRDKGFSGFISKPINHKVFATQIATVLEGTPVWDTNAHDDVII